MVSGGLPYQDCPIVYQLETIALSQLKNIAHIIVTQENTSGLLV